MGAVAISDLSRSATLAGYRDLATRLGLDPVRLLAEVDIPAAALAQRELKVSYSAVARLLELSAKHADRQDFGMLLAEGRQFSHGGAVFLLARVRPSLGEALQTIANLVWLSTGGISLSIDPAGDVTLIAMRRLQRPAGDERQATELAIGLFVRAVRTLLEPSWLPESVMFSHGAPPDLSSHRRVLGVAPTFDAEFDGVAVRTIDLSRPLESADVEAARVFEHLLSEQVAQNPTTVTEGVRQLVTAMLPSGLVSEIAVAARFNINKRTLHRQLAAEDTTFSAVVEDVRRGLLDRYVQDGRRSLTEIAGLLGYSSLSAFSRWRRARQTAHRPLLD